MEESNGENSIAPGANVILEPSEYLAFHLQLHTSPQAVLTIRNVSGDRIVAFKVKTTRPLRYLVRPNQGMLGPDGSASIVVSLQQKDCEELIRLDATERQTLNDKFLVQSIYIDNLFYENVRMKGSKELADELTQMWSHTDRHKLSNKKLRCRFVQDKSEIKEIALGTQQTTSKVYTAALSSGNREHAAAMTPRGVITNDSASMSRVNSSNDVFDKKDNKDHESKTSTQEVASLRKKYDELVAFTVQLTAQRDLLLSDLEKTRQHLQRTTADVQKYKKLAEESVSTLRNRKPGQNISSNANDDHSSNPASKKGKDPMAFGFFHILICAILFFVIGKYY